MWVAGGTLIALVGLLVSHTNHAKRDAKWQGKVEQALRDKLKVELNGDE